MDSLTSILAASPIEFINEQIIQLPNDVSTLDIIYKISTICIAAINLFFVCFFFIYKNRKDELSNEKSRKISLLKTIVLDYNMKHLYNFFDQIDEKTKELLVPNLSVDQKIIINESLIEYSKVLRQKFTDCLLAIDSGLYDAIIGLTDNMTDNFSENIFDEGIVLSNRRKFDEIITTSIIKTKTDIIKQLFGYKGDC
ncbi:MAG: hypothetical protein PHF97_12490 [Bacteroidales bacterium]|nr:hypothetical protein [Bacteroidales bacterium]